jgi:uncharacterized protein involved in outer membrane biogenesis
MERWSVRLLLVIVGLAGLWLVAGLVAKGVVSGATSGGLIASLEKSIGVPVSVGSADFDLSQWFLLRPAISLENITIGNPPGFRGRNLIEAKSLSAQVALLPLFQKTLEVHSIVLDRPRILVETNAQGASNVEAFLRKPKGKSPPSASGSGSESGRPAGLVIDELLINSGEIASEDLNINGIDIRLRDFSRESACRLEFSAQLFHGRNSKLRLDGQAGPFAPDSLPLSGQVTLTIAPDEMPPAFRRKQFGTLLVAPGDKARATFTASVRGDVYQTLRGPAKLAFSDFRIGKDEKHALPLEGEAPITFSAAKLMSAAPNIQLNMANARLRFGKGQWTGDAELQVRGSTASGKSSGKLGGVDINELLSSVTAADGKIYGLLEIPYSLQLAGKNADEIRNSLRGTGKLSVTQGRIAALDLLATIQQVTLHPEQMLEGKRGATPFSSLGADLNIGQSKLNVDGLALESPALRLNGRGVIDFDHNLNFDLVAHTSGDLAQLMNKISRPGQDSGLPLTVTGTVDAPKVRPKAGKIVSDVAGSLLDSFFKKKK